MADTARLVHETSVAKGAIVVRGLDKWYGAAHVLRGVDLTVEPGQVLVLLGPSGCGKTTLLRTIAGLERPDGGTISIGGTELSGPRTHVPPERRRIGMVFQDWALFPHLDVAANVGYGLSRDGDRAGRVEAALALVGLPAVGRRLPGTLSGGQQQRVALARALAPEPAVLLLDEPFSNLDTALRVQVRTEVHHLLADLGITTVFVTHDQEEAFALGDQVAVMRDGEIVQQAAPADLYAAPATPWVAGFVGDANLVEASCDGVVATTVIGAVRLRSAQHGPATVLLRPEELQLQPGEVDAGPVVELVEFYGHDTVFLVRVDGEHVLRVRAGSAPRFRRGDRVRISYAGPPAVAYTGAATPVESAAEPDRSDVVAAAAS